MYLQHIKLIILYRGCWLGLLLKSHKLGCLNIKHSFLTGGWKDKNQSAWRIGFRWGPTSWFVDGNLLLCLSAPGREIASSALFLILSGHSSNHIGSTPTCLPKTSSPKAITWGVRVSTYECWEKTNIQFLTEAFFSVNTIFLRITICILCRTIRNTPNWGWWQKWGEVKNFS